MLLRPGNHVIIIDKKNKASFEASILSVVERGFSLVLLSEMRLYPGDEIELEVPQREDALYVLQAKVLKAGENQEYTLQELDGTQRRQRRKSRRIPVNHRAECILLSDNKYDNDFLEGKIMNISRGGALLTVKNPLQMMSELQIIFEISLNKERAVSTGMKGKVVREHVPPLDSAREENVRQWEYSYGVEFEKPFAVLNS